MKGTTLVVFTALALLSMSAQGQNTQQEKMKACNVKAADKKGDERKAFMSDCLKAAPPA